VHITEDPVGTPHAAREQDSEHLVEVAAVVQRFAHHLSIVVEPIRMTGFDFVARPCR